MYDTVTFNSTFEKAKIEADDYIDNEGDLCLRVENSVNYRSSLREDGSGHTTIYIRRPEVIALRDHLNHVLGADKVPSQEDEGVKSPCLDFEEPVHEHYPLPKVKDLPFSYALDVVRFLNEFYSRAPLR